MQASASARWDKAKTLRLGYVQMLPENAGRVHGFKQQLYSDWAVGVNEADALVGDSVPARRIQRLQHLVMGVGRESYGLQVATCVPRDTSVGGELKLASTHHL